MNKTSNASLALDSPRTRGRLLASTLASCMLALLTGCAGLGVKPARGVDLTGQWKLNESLSEDPQALLRQQRQAARPSGFGRGMRGGFPSGGRGGRAHSGGSSRSSRAGSAGASGDYLSRPAEISIDQKPQQLHMVEDGTPTDLVYGEKVVVSASNGVAERTSGWKSHDFVIQYASKEGRGATRTYETAASGTQLIVTTKITGGRAPLEFRSTYEREPAAPAT